MPLQTGITEACKTGMGLEGRYRESEARIQRPAPSSQSFIRMIVENCIVPADVILEPRDYAECPVPADRPPLQLLRIMLTEEMHSTPAENLDTTAQ